MSLGQTRSSMNVPFLACGDGSCVVLLGSRLVLRAAVRTGYVWLSFELSCALRCGGLPSSAHGGRSWPDPACLAQAMRAAVRTSQVGACSRSFLRPASTISFLVVFAWSCAPTWRWWPRIPGLLVEGPTPDENLVSTRSLPAVMAPSGVVFLVGGNVVESFVLPTK
ncbi:hypothetical protein D1007_61036 [Hordeum vulgare]|nr:hypothetical protein D1007_61036 [Hordeum vulgare]